MRAVDNEKYMEEWHNTIVEAIQTGIPKDLEESLGKYIPFKIKKFSKGNAYEASFNVEQDGAIIRSYTITIGKENKRSIGSDYGKVSSKFQTIVFSEKDAGIGIANLEGGTGLYVLNTVARIVLEYAKSTKPQPAGFAFTASETRESGGTSQSRRKAYRALSLMLGKEAGYVNITKQAAMNTGSFFLMRHDLFERWQDVINQSGLS